MYSVGQSLVPNIDGVDLSVLISQGHQISFLKILLIVIGVFLARIINKQVMYILVGRVLKSQKYTNKKEENKRKSTLVAAMNTITTILYILLGMIAILYEIGINFSALIATFGALGVVLGIAGQSAIKDFLRGMYILIYDQMRVGDIVEILGKSGMVENISLQVVRLRDLDGNVHVIPNGDIKVVTNKTNSYANVNLDVYVAYDNDIDKIEKISNKVGAEIAKDPKWLEKIIDPVQFLRVDGFGDVSVKIKYLGKVLPGEQWQIAGEFRRRLKIAFEENNIAIPYPQRVLHEGSKATKSKK